MTKIIPAILTDDQDELVKMLHQLTGLVDWAQIDIMDGQFVKNRSVSLSDILVLKRIPFNLEAHLMVVSPQDYLKEPVGGQLKRIIFQVEVATDPMTVIAQIKAVGCEAGLAVKPETPLDSIKPYLNEVDLILLLGVQPGWQGQVFIPAVLNKITALRQMAPDLKIEVDGGINVDNIAKIAQAGADYCVVGSALMQSKDIKETLRMLEEKIST